MLYTLTFAGKYPGASWHTLVPVLVGVFVVLVFAARELIKSPPGPPPSSSGWVGGGGGVAVASGQSLLLDPVGESKLKMHSHCATSCIWAAAAGGYARGDGVAAIILKPLATALADGPSAEPQASMILVCYRRAGLDITKATDPLRTVRGPRNWNACTGRVRSYRIHFWDQQQSDSPVSLRADNDRHSTSPLDVGVPAWGRNRPQ
ncbi:hypothetical protein F5883DRAFT_2724 [Diaporthe sp. PMI_573]|nr:hypothetical protein F5883DRAFT_2724 [Diaporthaceae sp. PMI_573]